LKYHPDIDPAERLRFFADRMEAEGRLNVARHMRNGADEIERLRQRLSVSGLTAAQVEQPRHGQ
jgi:ubiquitin C-terminal hydrolase